jgi:hypothetical protein
VEEFITVIDRNKENTFVGIQPGAIDCVEFEGDDVSITLRSGRVVRTSMATLNFIEALRNAKRGAPVG